MTAKQLTDSILQMAIQGKLVPQNPNDEPACKLLDRIREKKKLLVKEGKLKKTALREEPIGDMEYPFVIPDNWKWVRLSYITELIEDCPHSTAPNEGTGFPLIRTSNVGFGKLMLDGVHRVSESVYNQRNRRAVPQSGDLIYAREAKAGNIAVIEEGQKVCLGQRTVLVRPANRLINPYWLAFTILSPYSYKTLVGKSYGTTVEHVNLSDLRPFILPLPPLEEQKRIVERFEEIMLYIQEYGKAYEEASKLDKELPNKLKKSILQEAIMGKLGTQDENDESANVLLEHIREEKKKLVKLKLLKKKDLEVMPINDEEKPFKIPMNWEWVRINSIANSQLGKTLDNGKQAGKEYPYLCSINVYWNGIDLSNVKTFLLKEDELERYRLQKGDLLVCEGGDYGRCSVWDRDEEMYYQNALHRIRFYGDVSPYYFKYVFEIFKHTGYLKGQGQTIKHFTYDSMKSILYPLPPLAEQKRIVEKIERLYAEIDNMAIKSNNDKNKQKEQR